jgi:hypothetical protein
MNGVKVCVDDNSFGLGEPVDTQIGDEFSFCSHAPAAPAADIVSDAAADEVKINIIPLRWSLFWWVASPTGHIAPHRVILGARNHLAGRNQLAAVDLGALFDQFHGLSAPMIGYKHQPDGAA